MKILFLTGWIGDSWKTMGAITTQNKLDYCNKHGYDFHVTRNYNGFDRPISWFKLREIYELLPKYDWIYWSDADVLLMNHERRLEEFIEKQVERSETVRLSPAGPSDSFPCPPLKEANYIISCDQNQPCMGSFLIRNCEWSFKFLNEIYKQEQFINSPIWDNQAQDYVLSTAPEWLEHIKLLPMTDICSLMTNYKEGDFLIHFAGMHQNHRDEEMKKFLDKVKK